MTFARQEVERMMPSLSPGWKAFHQLVTAETSFMVARSLINPRVYAEMGLDPEGARDVGFGRALDLSLVPGAPTAVLAPDGRFRAEVRDGIRMPCRVRGRWRAGPDVVLTLAVIEPTWWGRS